MLFRGALRTRYWLALSGSSYPCTEARKRIAAGSISSDKGRKRYAPPATSRVERSASFRSSPAGGGGGAPPPHQCTATASQTFVEFQQIFFPGLIPDDPVEVVHTDDRIGVQLGYQFGADPSRSGWCINREPLCIDGQTAQGLQQMRFTASGRPMNK